VLGVKIITIFPNNKPPHSSHNGFVLLFEGTYGEPIASIEAGSLTAIRTAAASGVATKYLARNTKNMTLALLGTGKEVYTHLQAMLAVRNITTVNLWNRTKSTAEKFMREVTSLPSSPKIVYHVFDTVKDAVKDADIICTLTHSATPILEGEWVKSGAHINAVGASQPNAQELSLSLLTIKRKTATQIFTDRKESVKNESGFYISAIKNKLIDEDHINGAELCDVVTRKGKGRISDDQITIFKSLGIAVEDIASGYYVYCKARENRRNKSKL